MDFFTEILAVVSCDVLATLERVIVGFFVDVA